MKRRTALLTVGGALAALAGCVEGGAGTEDGDRDTNAADSGTTTPGEGDAPEWALVPSGETVVDRVGTAVDRPECTVESETILVGEGDERETAETIPYPDVTEYDSVPEYVDAFEAAYVRHDTLCGHSGYVLTVAYTVEHRETLERFDDATVVFLLRYGGPKSGVAQEGEPMWVTDMAPGAIVYAVDTSGVARVEFEDVHSYERHEWTDEAPDPREDGTLVERFG